MHVAVSEHWLWDVESAFDGRVLGINNAVSDQWDRVGTIRSVPVIDGLLGATAIPYLDCCLAHSFDLVCALAAESVIGTSRS